jgi:hypothetical protein
VRLDEGTSQRAFEVAVNAPERPTRLQRINSGNALVETFSGGRRVFRGARKGTADFIGWHAGALALYLEVEAKAADGWPTPAQQNRARAVGAAGGVYVVIFADEEWTGSRRCQLLERCVERAVREVDEAIARRRARRA